MYLVTVDSKPGEFSYLLLHGSKGQSIALSSLSMCTSALDKREYLMTIRDKFSYFSIKQYVMTPHLNRLVETVQMRGHNRCI